MRGLPSTDLDRGQVIAGFIHSRAYSCIQVHIELRFKTSSFNGLDVNYCVLVGSPQWQCCAQLLSDPLPLLRESVGHQLPETPDLTVGSVG